MTFSAPGPAPLNCLSHFSIFFFPARQAALERRVSLLEAETEVLKGEQKTFKVLKCSQMELDAKNGGQS